MSKRRTTTATRAQKAARARAKVRLGELRIDLGRWNPDAAMRAGAGFPDCGLGEHHHVCPGCRVRVAWRPRSREQIARKIRAATDAMRVRGASGEALYTLEIGAYIDLLGVCGECADRLTAGQAVIAPGAARDAHASKAA